MDFIYNVDKPSAEEALQPGARLCAGEWCKYCKAANDCEEKTGAAVATLQEGFGPVDVLATDKPVTMNLPALSQMTDEQLKERVPWSKATEREGLLADALEEHIYRIIAELFGKDEGYCAGRGGGMHIGDFSTGHLGANAIDARTQP